MKNDRLHFVTQYIKRDYKSCYLSNYAPAVTIDNYITAAIANNRTQSVTAPIKIIMLKMSEKSNHSDSTDYRGENFWKKKFN